MDQRFCITEDTPRYQRTEPVVTCTTRDPHIRKSGQSASVLCMTKRSVSKKSTEEAMCIQKSVFRGRRRLV